VKSQKETSPSSFGGIKLQAPCRGVRSHGDGALPPQGAPGDWGNKEEYFDPLSHPRTSLSNRSTLEYTHGVDGYVEYMERQRTDSLRKRKPCREIRNSPPERRVIHPPEEESICQNSVPNLLSETPETLFEPRDDLT